MQSLEALPTVAKYNEKGLVLKRGISWDNAQIVVNTLIRMEKAIQWWIGDFLTHMEMEFHDKYLQFVPEGLSVDTWRQYKWVSERIPANYRRKHLSWSHHRVVAKFDLKQVKRYLDMAIKEKLSKSALDKRIKELNPTLQPKEIDSLEETDLPEDAGSVVNSPAIILCPKCGHKWEDPGQVISRGTDRP